MTKFVSCLPLENFREGVQVVVRFCGRRRMDGRVDEEDTKHIHSCKRSAGHFGLCECFCGCKW